MQNLAQSCFLFSPFPLLPPPPNQGSTALFPTNNASQSLTILRIQGETPAEKGSADSLLGINTNCTLYVHTQALRHPPDPTFPPTSSWRSDALCPKPCSTAKRDGWFNMHQMVLRLACLMHYSFGAQQQPLFCINQRLGEARCPGKGTAWALGTEPHHLARKPTSMGQPGPPVTPTPKHNAPRKTVLSALGVGSQQPAFTNPLWHQTAPLQSPTQHRLHSHARKDEIEAIELNNSTLFFPPSPLSSLRN